METYYVLPCGAWPATSAVLSSQEEEGWRRSGGALAIAEDRLLFSQEATIDWMNLLTLRLEGWRRWYRDSPLCPRRLNPRAWSGALTRQLQLEAMSMSLPYFVGRGESSLSTGSMVPYARLTASMSGLCLYSVIFDYSTVLSHRLLDSRCTVPSDALQLIRALSRPMPSPAAAPSAPAAPEAAAAPAHSPPAAAAHAAHSAGDAPEATAGSAPAYSATEAALSPGGQSYACGNVTTPVPDASVPSCWSAALSMADVPRAAALELSFDSPVSASEQADLLQVRPSLPGDIAALYLGWTITDTSLVLDFLVYDYDSFRYICTAWGRSITLSNDISCVTMVALSPCAEPLFLYGHEHQAHAPGQQHSHEHAGSNMAKAGQRCEAVQRIYR